MFRGLCWMLPALALSCASKTVALDRAVIVGSSDPTVVGTVHESVGQIAVDDERLYWNATPSRYGSLDYGTWALRGCMKEDCASTVATYDDAWSAEGFPFGVVGGQIYWFEFGANNVIELGVPDQYLVENVTLVSRPVAGGAKQTLTAVDSLELFVFDSDGIYVSTATGIYAIPFSRVTEPPQLIAPPPELGAVSVIAASGDYVYWLASGVAARPTQAASLRRIRKDGSATPETLAGGLEINPGAGLTV